ncbi:hypothetical protein N7466_003864 [Penicillium verhagenii]|uniref:uncharacterized protein n=1 Tax=Penicillium verhagenii TaxID=1562060 RepID=UPI002545A25F|nr:uncharacterized protein N7466_003864 [Penicillium verhagenii]KAJ5934317.1 hypothetical protein N7466_003864 [Penicillium verhagenii]
MPDASHLAPSLDEEERYGLVTQTILASPVIKWILPARLRNQNLNDVVFVSHNRVQIKEATGTSYLQDVAEKTDFSGSIDAAKVLNVITELPLESQIRSEATHDGPAQILVLVVGMKELFFLYCSPLKPKQFVTFRVPFPINVSLEIRFGKQIAVDPKSRAVAVCAAKNFFGIMRLKPPHEIQNEMLHGVLNPIQEEKYFQTDGIIMFMEFLYPKSADDKNIMLLLILQREGVTYAERYSWQEGKELSALAPELTKFKLRKQHRLPTMIVPLTKESSFLVLTTTSMAVYPSDGSHPPTRYPYLAPNPDISGASMWTRWARPARNWLYSQSHDGIYLCREDGWIYLLEFGNEGDLETQTSLGQIQCDVDMAFDVLDMGSQGGDFILASGSTGDGGLFIQEARAGPRCVQRFANWAPVRDATMVYPVTQANAHGGIASNRLFACSDSTANGGALHEFRWGIEAQQGFNVPLDDFSHVRDMWIMPDIINDSVYILLSDHLSTLVLHLDPASEEPISALDEEQTGLDDRQTLAAGCTPSGVLIQITEDATHFFALHNLSLNKSVSHKGGIAILAVAIDGPGSTVVTAMRDRDQICLYLSKIVDDGEQVHLNVSEPVNIAKEPVCLCLQTFGGKPFIFLGNPDGTIDVFVIEDDTIVFVFETSIALDEEYSDLSTVVESFATIRTNSSDGALHAFLLCGLRSGMLVSFKVDFDSSTLIELQQKQANRIGTTSIRLKGQNTFALLTCGDELWYVSYSFDCMPSEYFIRQVWITDQSNPAYFPLSISGFDVIGLRDSELEASSGNLFCFADRQLLICSLNQEAKVVPRRIGLPGKPQKMVYSKILQTLILAYSVPCFENPDLPLNKTVKSYIEFVDPDTQKSLVHGSTMQPWQTESSRGETITCILDWEFERDGEIYHMVAIGTSMPILESCGPRQGRLILMVPRRDSSAPESINCLIRYTRILDGPINAMAAYKDGLIIGAGNRLIPVPSKTGSTTWHKGTEEKLPSTVVSISVHGQFVFVLTARHSWLVFEIIRKSETNESSVLVLRSWDHTRRDGLTHVACHENGDKIFVSFLGGKIFGAIPSKTYLVHPNLTLPSAVPEATLDESVLRFVSDRNGGNVLYGFNVSGSICRFLLPKADELQLLSFLQNICYRDRVLAPSASRKMRRRDPHDLTGYHIDGDILYRLSQRGPDFLEAMITSLGSSSPRSNSAEELFNQLALQVVGQLSVEAVLIWLRKMLDITI